MSKVRDAALLMVVALLLLIALAAAIRPLVPYLIVLFFICGILGVIFKRTWY